MIVQLLQSAEDLLVTVSRTLNMELSIDQLVQHFSETKNELELKHNRIADEGLQLVDRLNQPILIDDRSITSVSHSEPADTHQRPVNKLSLL